MRNYKLIFAAGIVLILHFLVGCQASLSVPGTGTSPPPNSDRSASIAVPTVTSISPISGAIAGGTSVTIFGTNFSRVTSVAIGSSLCESVTLSSSTSLTCVTSAGAAGQFPVTLTNSAGAGKLSNAFSYGGADTWYSISVGANSPSARQYQSQVWTGSKMIIWGGQNGGQLNTGSIYDPTTDTWAAMTAVGAPSARAFHGAVWTGTRMMIWGGWNGATEVATGGLYNPQTDSWTTVSTTGAPLASAFPNIYWTGTRVMVWSGVTPYSSENATLSGGFYDPTNDTWTPMSTAGAQALAFASVAFSGTDLFQWSGSDGTNPVTSGSRYNLATDSWSPMNAAGMSASLSGSAVWSGTEMLIWGGLDISRSMTLGIGFAYNPVSDSWRPLGTTNISGPSFNEAAVWTGTRMIIWAGENTPVNSDVNTGGVFDPVANTWTQMSVVGAPPPVDFVFSPNQIWTGSQFLIWGGGQHGTSNGGGRYTP